MNTPNPTPSPDKLAETPTRPISRDYKGDGSTRDYIEDLNAYADAKERELAAVVAERDGNGKRATRAEKKWDELLGRLDVAESALTQLRAENEKLRGELTEAEKYATGVHTCHDSCPRVACVLRREVAHLKAELERAGGVATAASALTAKMAMIHDDPLYRAVWECAANHGVSYYHGPTYEAELKTLNAALSAHLNPKKTP